MVDVAWDVAAVGIVGTIVGATGTYLAGVHQTRSQQRALREERLQRRLEIAYRELLTMLSETRHWASSVYPLWSAMGKYTMPPMPQPFDNQARVEAQITAVWSPRVQQLMVPWREAFGDVYNYGVMISEQIDARNRGVKYPPHEDADSKSNLDAAKKRLFAATEAIQGQARLELRGEHDGRREPDASGG